MKLYFSQIHINIGKLNNNNDKSLWWHTTISTQMAAKQSYIQLTEFTVNL